MTCPSTSRSVQGESETCCDQQISLSTLQPIHLTHVQLLILEDFWTAWRQPDYTRAFFGNNTSCPKPTVKPIHSHVQADRPLVDSHAQPVLRSMIDRQADTWNFA